MNQPPRPTLPAESLAPCPVSTEVLNELNRAVLAARDPLSRAAVLRSLVYELYDTTAWMGRAHLVEDELRSLQLVLDAVDAHQARQVEANGQTQQLPLDAVAS